MNSAINSNFIEYMVFNRLGVEQNSLGYNNLKIIDYKKVSPSEIFLEVDENSDLISLNVSFNIIGINNRLIIDGDSIGLILINENGSWKILSASYGG